MTTVTDELLSTVRADLSTAQLGDVLDTLGRRDQFLPPQIQPGTPAATMLVGRAMPVLEIAATPDDHSFGLMFEALDSLETDEVYVAAADAPPFALWGELMNTRAQSNGAAGAVLDGYIRDTRAIRAMTLPVFARGSYAQDQRGRGRVVAYREPVRIANVAVRPGDLIVADDDGVLCVPSDVAAECVEKALEKRRIEDRIAREIQDGLSTSDAYSKYGVM
jgi:regulator of RNase E activity RraA